MTLVSTHLVQRLRAPQKQEGALSTLGEVFSFGGGYKNGGLSEDAMKLLRGVFSFDYMGAAEYEFGAVPESIREMAKNAISYQSWTYFINKTPIYVVAPKALESEINERLDQIADEKAGYIKCGCDLKSAVGKSKWTKKEDCHTIGYLELDNHFAFFVDKTAWEGYCKLFGIQTNLIPNETKAPKQKRTRNSHS